MTGRWEGRFIFFCIQGLIWHPLEALETISFFVNIPDTELLFAFLLVIQRDTNMLDNFFSFRVFLDQTWTLDLVNKLGQWMLNSFAITVGFPISKTSQYLPCITALLPWQFSEAKPNNKNAPYLPVHLHQVNITGEGGSLPLSLKAIWQLTSLRSSHLYCPATSSTTEYVLFSRWRILRPG